MPNLTPRQTVDTLQQPSFEQDYEAATQKGIDANLSEVHATSASYDAATRQLVLTLRGGLTLLVPVHLLQGVAGAAPELIGQVELVGNGYAVHWEALDADFTIQGIAAGSFGTKAWMKKLDESGLLDKASQARQSLLAARDEGALAGLTASDIGRRGGLVKSAAKARAAAANGARGGRPRGTSPAIKRAPKSPPVALR